MSVIVSLYFMFAFSGSYLRKGSFKESLYPVPLHGARCSPPGKQTCNFVKITCFVYLFSILFSICLLFCGVASFYTFMVMKVHLELFFTKSVHKAV